MLKFHDGDKILFTGDSVTDSGRGRPIGEGLWEGVGNGYVRSIDTMLNVCYPELLLHVCNTGTSGNTSRDLRERWQTEVLDLEPDYLVMCIGFNDVWRQFDSPACRNQHVQPEEYRENLVQMIDSALPKVKELILMTPYYMEPCREDRMRARMDEYRAIMQEVAKERGLCCIDLQKEFDDYLQYRHSSYITWDRVHPGWIGSLIITRAFLRMVGFDRQVI